MKKLLFFLLAIIFAIQGWSQVTLNEGFEGTTFPPDDWTKVTTQGTVSWERYTSDAPRGLACASVNYNDPNHTNYLITPKLIVSSDQDSIVYWVKTSYDYGGTTLNVLVSTTDNAVTSFSTTSLQTVSTLSESWVRKSIPLTNYIGEEIYIAFQVVDFYGSRVMLDDVTGPELFVPTCPKPTALSASNPTTSGVDLGWTDATGSIWNIQYMLNSETDWANATTITGVTNPYTFATLNGSTTYKARVQTDCGAELSEWSSPISFSTACDVITIFPWHEGFEGDWVSITAPGNRPAPNCWTVVDRGVEDSYYDYFWESNVDMSPSGTSHSGSRHAACYTDYGDSDHNDWLISPMISLTGNERLRFWAMRANNSTNEPDEISVYISDDTFTTLDTTGMGQTGNMPGFTQIFTQALPVGDWVQYEINLNQHVGNKYIAFVRQGTPDGYVLRLDDVEISELPTCIRPTNVIVSSITTTDAEVSWTNGNSADAAWWIYYKQTTATTYDSVQVFSNPYTLTTLIPSSGYDIYVVTDCSTELSEASPIVNFRTLCDEISTLPWSDNFDTYGTASGTFPPCWTRPVINNNSGTDFPSIDGYTYHTSPASIKFRTVTTTPTYSVTPAFTADLNTLMVSFWLKAEGVGSSQSGTITVGVMSNPNDTTTFEAVRLISPSTTDWIEYRIMLAGIQLQGSGNYIAFKHNSNANNWYYWLDDVEVDEIPACPNVYGLTVGAASTTSVSVNWDNSIDDGTGFNVAYASNVVGTFDPATSMIIPVPSGTTLPYIIPGFNPGDSIWVAVQRGCLGSWTEAQKINLPEFANQLPFYANFENSLEDEIWTITNGTQTNKWYIGVPGANDSDPTDGIDERGLYISSDNGATATYSSASSIVFVSTLVEFDNSPAFELSFDWANNGEINWHDLNVYLMPLSIALTPGTLPNSQYQINTASLAEETSFHTFTRVFDGSYSNSVKQLVFAWQNDEWGNYNPPARVDNISFVALTCGMPYGLAMDSASYNGTDVYLSWTEPQGATDWIVEYQQTGTTAWQQVAANSNPFTLTGLNPGTSYQARVRSICFGTDTSAISNVINFQTACVALTVPTLVEGFNTVPPSTCWERKDGLLPATGNSTLSSTTSGWYSHSTPIMPNAGNHAYINIYGANTKYWLISPSYDLGDGTTPAQIEFDVILSNYSASGAPDNTGTDDRFAVVVSTDNGLTWDVANAFIWSNDASATRVYNNLYPLKHIILPLFDPATSLPYTGNVKIAFYGESTVSNADNYLHIDNFEILPFATCQRPTSLGASAVSSTTANISFQENGNSTTWQYVLSDGLITDPDNGVAIITTDNPILLTNLIPQTQYTIWVRSDCTTEASIWSNPLTFVTEALPASVPYTFDFEDQTEALAWRNLSGSVNNWAIGQAAGNGPSSQNSGDNTATYISNDNGQSYAMSSGNIYAYTYRDIDFGSTPASYSLTFDWKCQGYVYNSSAYSGLIVYLRDITDTLNPTGYPSNVNDNLGLFAQQSTWQTEQLPLDNVSGVKRLIFFYFDGYYNYAPPAAIDNISINLESCPRPFDVAVSGATTTTAEVSWNHPGATDFIVSYRTNTTGSTLIDIPATSSPITIQGLTSGTAYLLAVRAICNGDTTIYSETVQFTTPCADGAISSFPWTEGFESGIACWQQEYVNGNLSWINNAGYNDDTLAHEGSQIALFKGTARTNVTKLISPLFDISALPTPYLSYWYIIQNWGTTDRDTLKVYSRPSSDSSWTLLSTFYALDSYSWKKDSVLLPSPSSTYQIAFEGLERYGYGVGLDDITIYDPSGSSCAAPTDLVVNALNTSASITWTPSGSEVSWEVKLNSGGTPEIVGSPSKTFTGLTPNTNYTAFVRSNCGDGTSSAWISAPFTTSNVQTPPVVSTTVPNAQITQTTAVFNASFVQGSDPILTRGFDYKIATDANWTNVSVTDETNPFTYAATGLIANTQYLVRGFVSTATEGVVVGDTATFTTLAIIPPTVTTDTVITNTDAASAVFQGTTSQGTDAIIARGFEYKLLADDWSTAIDLTASGSANITATVTGLSAVKYQVRAYAETLDGGKTYGDILDFNMSTSINSIDTDNLNVNLYPNPASNNTNLSIKGINGKVKISITDVQGRTISTIERESSNGEVNHSINLEAYAKGVYYIRIQSESSIKTQKLIVQ